MQHKDIHKQGQLWFKYYVNSKQLLYIYQMFCYQKIWQQKSWELCCSYGNCYVVSHSSSSISMDWSCRKSGIVQAEQHWQSHVRAKSVCDLFNDRLLNVRFRHPGMWECQSYVCLDTKHKKQPQRLTIQFNSKIHQSQCTAY